MSRLLKIAFLLIIVGVIVDRAIYYHFRPPDNVQFVDSVMTQFEEYDRQVSDSTKRQAKSEFFSLLNSKELNREIVEKILKFKSRPDFLTFWEQASLSRRLDVLSDFVIKEWGQSDQFEKEQISMRSVSFLLNGLLLKSSNFRDIGNLHKNLKKFRSWLGGANSRFESFEKNMQDYLSKHRTQLLRRFWANQVLTSQIMMRDLVKDFEEVLTPPGDEMKTNPLEEHLQAGFKERTPINIQIINELEHLKIETLKNVECLADGSCYYCHGLGIRKKICRDGDIGLLKRWFDEPHRKVAFQWEIEREKLKRLVNFFSILTGKIEDSSE